MSITVIAVLAAGGVVGAILGELSAAGWVIGLVVAGLTIGLSALLRRYSYLTPPDTKSRRRPARR